MPTVSFGRFDSSFAGRPDRMAPGDYDIWLRWWPSVREGTLSLLFDVGVGSGLPLDPLTPAGALLAAPFDFRDLQRSPKGSDGRLAFMHLRNTQKRIDVIVEREDVLWIVELRFAAQASAIGRLKMYADLWARDPIIDKSVVLYLVTDRADPDVKDVAENMGMVYIVT